jgi:hypothetical protein
MPSPLGLSENDYWGDFTWTSDQFSDFVAETGFTGIRIDAPSLVAIEQRDTAPVVGYFSRTLRDDFELNAERQMIAVAVDLTSKRLRAGLALDTGKTPAPEPPPAGLDPGEGLTFTGFASDLRRQLDLPWEDRKYVVAFLLREHVSNAVRMELGPSPTAYRDPVVEQFLADQRKVARIPPPGPVHPAPNPKSGVIYERISRSPEIPKEPGIVLSVERVAVARRGSTCLCFGSFRLPVTFAETVRPDPETGELPEVGDRQAKAVVPLTLVVTGSARAGPWILEFRVPSYDSVSLPKTPPAPDQEVGVVTGQFAIDLFSHPGMPRNPMTYFITAFGGGLVSGPFCTAVVTEKMLRAQGVEQPT